jgi:hypothetical protein
MRRALSWAALLAIAFFAGVLYHSRVGSKLSDSAGPRLTLTGVVTSSARRQDSTGFIRVVKTGSAAGRSGKVVPVAADGSFSAEVAGLPGRYTLTAVLGVGAPAGVDRHSEIARTTIDVGTAPIRNIAMVASPGASLRGRVLVEGGSLKDVGPLRIFMKPVDADGGWPPYMSVLAAADGSFELRNVLWRGAVATDLPPEGRWIVKGVSAGGRDISGAGVDPVPRSLIDDVRVVIRQK